MYTKSNIINNFGYFIFIISFKCYVELIDLHEHLAFDFFKAYYSTQYFVCTEFYFFGCAEFTIKP